MTHVAFYDPTGVTAAWSKMLLENLKERGIKLLYYTGGKHIL